MNPYITTLSGEKLFQLTPHLSTITVRDIAHSLAFKCRFSGHCSEQYSVAQHSVLVGRLLPRKWAVHGLLHDSPEVFTGDIAGTWKHRISVDGVSFEDFDRTILAQIYAQLCIPFPTEKAIAVVKAMDAALLAAEFQVLMPWSPCTVEPADIAIEPWTAQTAERIFLEEYTRWRRPS